MVGRHCFLALGPLEIGCFSLPQLVNNASVRLRLWCDHIRSIWSPFSKRPIREQAQFAGFSRGQSQSGRVAQFRTDNSNPDTRHGSICSSRDGSVMARCICKRYPPFLKCLHFSDRNPVQLGDYEAEAN